VRIGMNSRLDTLQAAILLEKLAIYADEIERRQVVSRRYSDALGDVVGTPGVMTDCLSVWAQYTLRVHDGGRDGLAKALAAAGVPSAIYYPKPLHLQTAYRHYPVAEGGLPASERASGEVLALPMHPYLEAAVQDRIIAAVREALAARGRAAAE
jgi:dTDP-4-amino-4,6-dideoxygalactose transaminase